MSTRILRLPDVCEMVGLSPSSVLRMCRAGTFARKRVLSRNAVGWVEDEVLQWVLSREAGTCRKPPEIPAVAGTMADTAGAGVK